LWLLQGDQFPANGGAELPSGHFEVLWIVMEVFQGGNCSWCVSASRCLPLSFLLELLLVLRGGEQGALQ
jgi:hypothetical protein